MDIQELNNAIAAEFEIDASVITPDASIKETLELDSLSLLDLVAVVGDATGIRVKGAEVSHLVTFGDLYQYLEHVGK